MLANDSNFYDRSQTTNRVMIILLQLYRLSAHIVFMMMATLIAFGASTKTNSSSNPDIVGVLFVAVVSLFSVTYFISLHGDLSQGILVSIFIEQRLNGMNQAQNEEHQNEQNSKVNLLRPVDMVKNLHTDDYN